MTALVSNFVRQCSNPNDSMQAENGHWRINRPYRIHWGYEFTLHTTAAANTHSDPQKQLRLSFQLKVVASIVLMDNIPQPRPATLSVNAALFSS
jgi:hypothetical protein